MAATLTAPGGSAAGRLLRSGRRDRWRRFADRAWSALCVLATVGILIPLVIIIGFVTVNGAPAITLEFLTTAPQGASGGGALNAILGTLQIVPLATLFAAPIGVLGALFLHEFPSARAAQAMRFAADVAVGLPSVVVGIFAYTLFVAPFGTYNAFAGTFALAVIMVPIILRSSEEVLRLVPGTLREASLALGVPVWRTALSVVARTGLGGILTGVMLAVARAAGETAPLLLTTLGFQYVNVGDFTQQMDALPVFVYQNSALPDPTAVSRAWGAAFLLLVMVLVVNIVVRARTIGRRVQ